MNFRSVCFCVSVSIFVNSLGPSDSLSFMMVCPATPHNLDNYPGASSEGRLINLLIKHREIN